ncbi:hypothetical protein WJX73_002599 [Symbiochloris irregularis]|uniref:Glycosyltransferase n=1 Tax=Symbiochloris irregularis TaxID=706552 RepID=A0AAW1PET1_9CHLO
MMLVATVIAFCRFPTPGQAKTRLAAGTDNQTAARLYKTCAEQIFLQVDRTPNFALQVACSRASELSLVTEWLSSIGLSVPCVPQITDEDLGERMLDALGQATQGLGRKAILIGTDIPDISQAILERASELLDTYQVVLGPAADGGYYLVGVSDHHPGLFQGVTWSASTTLEETVQNAAQLGLSISHEQLPVLQDIDTVEDLTAWHAEAAEQHSTDSQFFKEADTALRALAA